MNNSEYKILKNLFGQQNTFTIPKLLVKLTGSHTKALFLNQLIFWSSKKDDGWFYKKYADWNEEILIIERQVRRFTREFESQGFLETKIKKVNNTPHCWYKINFNKLFELLNGPGQNVRMDPDKMSESLDPDKMSESYITEDYHKTTTTEEAEIAEEEVRKEKEEEAIAEAVEFEKKRISKQDNANQDIYQQVIQVFNEVIPERKAPLRPTKKLKSNIDELIEIWPDISKQGFMFSIERFKKYLLKLRKTSFPLGTYTDTNGQEQRRNIVMILSPDVFINTMSS